MPALGRVLVTLDDEDALVRAGGCVELLRVRALPTTTS
jgi:hypothetical protein